MILLAASGGPGQTARMRRLIWAFAVSICSKISFRMARPIRRLIAAEMYNMVHIIGRVVSLLFSLSVTNYGNSYDVVSVSLPERYMDD